MALAMRGSIKIALVMVLNLPLASGAYAQETSWKQLTTQFMTLYRQGRYAEAFKVAEEALKVAENTSVPDHPNVARLLEKEKEKKKGSSPLLALGVSRWIGVVVRGVTLLSEEVPRKRGQVLFLILLKNPHLKL